MGLLLGKWLRRLELWLYKHSINDALALHRRNEVRPDGLAFENVCTRLEISWCARDVHPWDRDLPPGEKEIVFMQQTLEDTEAAIIRTFERLPTIDIIDVSVIEPRSEALLASGTVQRPSLKPSRLRCASVRMRLGEMGIRCHLTSSDIPTNPTSYVSPVDQWPARHGKRIA